MNSGCGRFRTTTPRTLLTLEVHAPRTPGGSQPRCAPDHGLSGRGPEGQGGSPPPGCLTAQGDTAYPAVRPLLTLLDYLEAGEALNVFLDHFPSVSHEQAVVALELAKEMQDAHAHPA